MRAALKHLERHGGLDLKSLEAEGKKAEAFLRDLEASKRVTWFERKPQFAAVLVVLIASAWCGVTWHDRFRLAVALGTTVLIEGCILWGPVARLLARVRALESELAPKKDAPHEQ